MKTVAVKQYPNGVTTETGGDPFRWYVKANGSTMWCRQERKWMRQVAREDNAKEQDRVAMRFAIRETDTASAKQEEVK